MQPDVVRRSASRRTIRNTGNGSRPFVAIQRIQLTMHHFMTKPRLVCDRQSTSICDGEHLSATDFAALVPREPTSIGPAGIKRRTCVFTDWPNFETEDDYLEDDGAIETEVNPMYRRTEPSTLPVWAVFRARMPLEERAALNAADWCAVDTLAEYIGPTILKTHAREYLDGRRAWREAYRPILRLLGGARQSTPGGVPGVQWG